VQADGRVGCGRLSAADPCVILAGRARRQQLSAVGVDLDECDADVGAPADRVKGDVSGVAENDEPRYGALCARQAPLAALPADSVSDDEVPAVYGEADAIAIDNCHRASWCVAQEN
jgi:hypothetical protein